MNWKNGISLNKKEYRKNWRMNHRNEYKEYRRKYNLKSKIKVLSHYSGNPPKCACCGETEICFLSIDHINGGGNKERKQIKGNFYLWFINNNFPEGYQVLCMNCQFGRKCNKGICPHQELKQSR